MPHKGVTACTVLRAEYRDVELIKVQNWSGGRKEECCLTPGSGEAFRDFEHGPEMVIVPAGEFMMGITAEEALAIPQDFEHLIKYESPRHRVTIPVPFAIGRYAVSFAEWEAFVKVGGGHEPDDCGWGRNDRPVIYVSWNDAQAYLTWISNVSGHEYRLPTESEWEYAARAGTTTPFWWGSSISTDQANYDGKIRKRKSIWDWDVPPGEDEGVYREMTLPVHSFEPNPWGLYQVHGNVWEWCQDRFHETYENKPDRLKDTGGAWMDGKSVAYVHRGGCLTCPPHVLRSACRSYNMPDLRTLGIGFRVARTLEM